MTRLESKSLDTQPLRPRQPVGGGAAPAADAAKPSAAATAPMTQDAVKLTPSAKDAKDFGDYLQGQGNTNACGTTSLAMLLSFWKGKDGAFTREQIDNQIRRFNMPTSPHNIVDFANANGFRSVAKNGSFDELQGLVEKGVPVQIMYDPNNDGGDSILHYVNVVGFEKDASGKVTGVKIADPAEGQIGKDGGGLKTVPVAEFKEKWDDLKLLGRATGLNNLMITHLPKENQAIVGADGVVRQTKDIALPKSEGLGWRVWLMDKVFDAGTGVSKLWDGVKSAGKAVASAPGKVVGFVKGLFS